ncbi:MAG: hypothetical protein ABIR91_05450 [Candidatus Saccharimonadales bacterium]
MARYEIEYQRADQNDWVLVGVVKGSIFGVDIEDALQAQLIFQAQLLHRQHKNRTLYQGSISVRIVKVTWFGRVRRVVA